MQFHVFSFLDQADKYHSLLSCRSLYLQSTSSAVICYFFPVSVAGIYHKVVFHCETMLFQFTASLVSPFERVALQVLDCVCVCVCVCTHLQYMYMFDTISNDFFPLARISI